MLVSQTRSSPLSRVKTKEVVVLIKRRVSDHLPRRKDITCGQRMFCTYADEPLDASRSLLVFHTTRTSQMRELQCRLTTRTRSCWSVMHENPERAELEIEPTSQQRGQSRRLKVRERNNGKNILLRPSYRRYIYILVQKKVDRSRHSVGGCRLDALELPFRRAEPLAFLL